MLFILLDEPTIFVSDSRACAEREIEPIDAESELRAAFDEFAVPYRANWLRQNRRKKLFGLLTVISPGQYWFVPNGPPDPRSLIKLLKSYPITNIQNIEVDVPSILANLQAQRHDS